MPLLLRGMAAGDDDQFSGLTVVCRLQLNAAASLLVFKPKPMLDTNKVGS